MRVRIRTENGYLEIELDKFLVRFSFSSFCFLSLTFLRIRKHSFSSSQYMSLP